MDIKELPKYAHIEFELKDWPGIKYRGQLRGIIHSVDNYCFDRNGKAFWITSDNGIEIFDDIENILSLKVLD